MIEKTQGDSLYLNYQKKIIPYLDGSLSAQERSEFEAFVRTHPDFSPLIKAKEDELLFIKSKIPAPTLSLEGLSSLEGEIKLSIFHLLKESPKNFWDKIKERWEDWSSR
jgi:anti-sigma-K factor RskA